MRCLGEMEGGPRRVALVGYWLGDVYCDTDSCYCSFWWVWSF